MKIVQLLLTVIILSSCSSKQGYYAIESKNADALKYESLSRYNNKRLETLIKAQKPLALCHAGRYNEGLELLKQKLDKNLNNYEYWNSLGICYFLDKEYPKARTYFNLALASAKKKKDKAIVLNNISLIYLKKEKYYEGKDYLAKSIELDKRALTPRFNLAQIYLKFGSYSNAKSELELLIRKNSRDIDILGALGHLNLMTGKYKTALSYYNKIPATYKSRDDIATNIAMIYLKLNFLENAKKTIAQADKKDKLYSLAQVEILKEVEEKLKIKSEK